MGVWIETVRYDADFIKSGSHPAWVCGLKQNIFAQMHPTQVTPCVGVWIETSFDLSSKKLFTSHPAWVCGLKLLKKRRFSLILSHTLRGCVD